MQANKEILQEFLEHFDHIFGTDTKKNFDYYFNKLQLLNQIYERFEEDFCETSQMYDKVRKQHSTVIDMLDKSFSKAQETLFEKHYDLGSELASIECEQMFYFRFCNCKNIRPKYRIKTDRNQ